MTDKASRSICHWHRPMPMPAACSHAVCSSYEYVCAIWVYGLFRLSLYVAMKLGNGIQEEEGTPGARPRN